MWKKTMLSKYAVKFNLVLYLIYYFINATGATQDGITSITISLNKTYTFDNREIFGDFITVQNYSTIKVNFTDLPVNNNVTFLLFQAHSFLNNITLYQNIKSFGTIVNGTNIGMVSIIKDDINDIPNIKDIYYIENINNATTQVYISVHIYEVNDTYPGGCNMEFPIDIAPYLVVETNPDYINVVAAVASENSQCTVTKSGLSEFYMMYLPEMSFNEKEYFDGLRKMITLENINKYGTLLPQTSIEMRRTLSAYPNTGVIIVVVAKDTSLGNGYSVYVPNHSYGCPQLDENGCIISQNTFIQALCMVLVPIGLFISLFGHRFFKTEMFLSGFFCGLIISYILINIIGGTDIDIVALILASIISGVIFGATWLLFWWLYGIPVVAVLLPSLNLGFLLASIFFYRLPPIGLFLQEDLNFWSLFNFLLLLTALTLVSMTYSASILCGAVLGAFTTVFGLDFFMGSNLKYIIINTIRRAIVPKFQYAVLAPPFQWRELVLTLLWIILAISGWMYQHWHNRGRPPFPPPPRSTRPVAPSPGYGTLNPSILQQPRTIFDSFRASNSFRNYWITEPDNNERSPLVYA